MRCCYLLGTVPETFSKKQWQWPLPAQSAQVESSGKGVVLGGGHRAQTAGSSRPSLSPGDSDHTLPPLPGLELHEKLLPASRSLATVVTASWAEEQATDRLLVSLVWGLRGVEGADSRGPGAFCDGNLAPTEGRGARAWLAFTSPVLCSVREGRATNGRARLGARQQGFC